jgi:hypothetical protein
MHNFRVVGVRTIPSSQKIQISQVLTIGTACGTWPRPRGELAFLDFSANIFDIHSVLVDTKDIGRRSTYEHTIPRRRMIGSFLPDCKTLQIEALQVIDVLEAQIKRRPAMKKVSTAVAKQNRNFSELSLQTFCTFPREFSSDRRQ